MSDGTVMVLFFIAGPIAGIALILYLKHNSRDMGSNSSLVTGLKWDLAMIFVLVAVFLIAPLL